MMDLVESPEKRNHVVEAVPPIGPEIPEDNSADRMQCSRRSNPLQDAIPILMSIKRDCRPYAAKKYSTNDGIDTGKCQITQPVSQPLAVASPLKLPDKRKKGFPEQEQR